MAKTSGLGVTMTFAHFPLFLLRYGQINERERENVLELE